MKSTIIRIGFAVLLVGLVLGAALYESIPSKAVVSRTEYPPLHAGIGSPGSQVDPAQQAIENPAFFALVKTDWPLLGIAEPRTAWEYVQRGMYRQDDLEDEDGAIDDYHHAEELLVEIAHRTGDETLPERMRLIHFRLGPIFLHRGQWEDAIRHFHFLLEENPETAGINRESALAYYGMGRELLDEGHEAEAQEAFEHAYESFQHELELDPLNQLTLFEFGEFLHDHDVHLEGVDQEGLARQYFQEYLAQAVLHCDTYPLRVLEVDRLARSLGGEGNDLAIQYCVERQAVR